MKHLRHLIGIVVLPALILTIFAVSSVIGAGQEKTTICHITGNGSFHQITVANPALPAHLAHGDVLPDEYGDCP